MNRFIAILLTLLVVLLPLSSCGGGDSGAYVDGKTTSGNQSVVNRPMKLDSIQDHSIDSKGGLREYRAYYVDITESMIRNRDSLGITLLAHTKKSLKKAIRQADDNILIDIICFGDAGFGIKEKDYRFSYLSDFNSEQLNKSSLIKFVNNIKVVPMNGSQPPSDELHPKYKDVDYVAWTNHFVPINDFTENRIKEGCINTIYLLTDGENNEGGLKWKTAFESLKHKAVNISNNSERKIHGYYVALNTAAEHSPLYEEFNESDSSHFGIVNSADFDINHFGFLVSELELDSIRQKPYVKIAYTGDFPKELTPLNTDIHCPFNVKIDTVDVALKKVVLKFEQKDADEPLSDFIPRFKIKFLPKWEDSDNKTNFPKNNVPITISCKDAKDRAILISGINELNNLNLKYYEKIPFFSCFDWKPENHIQWKNIDVRFSPDALKANKIVRLKFDKPEYLRVLNNDGTSTYEFKITGDTTLYVGFVINPGKELAAQFNWTVTAMCDNIERLLIDERSHPDNTVINNICYTEKKCNPWWWLIITILLLPFLIWGATTLLHMWIRNMKPKFPGVHRAIAIISATNDIVNYGLIGCGAVAWEKGLPSVSAIKTYKVKDLCVKEINLLSHKFGKPQDIRPKNSNGWIFNITCNFQDNTIDNLPITRISISPFSNHIVLIKVFNSSGQASTIKLDVMESNPADEHYLDDGNNHIITTYPVVKNA